MGRPVGQIKSLYRNAENCGKNNKKEIRKADKVLNILLI
jgi:hypothetical protein